MNLYRKQHPVSLDENSRITVPGFAPVEIDTELAKPKEPYQYRITSLVTSQLNVAYGFSLNIPASFKAELKGDVMFYLLELMALLPETTEPSNKFDGLVWGLGIRVAIAATNLDSNLTASIAGVAASSSLKLSTANYAVVSEGLGPDILDKAGPFFKNATGSFNAEQIQNMGQGLQQISQFLSDSTANHPPKPVFAISETPKTESAIISSVSTCYALNRITVGNSFNEAKKELKKDVAPEAYVNLFQVMSIYYELVHNAGDDKPTEEQKKHAKKILDLKGFQL